MNNEFSSHSVFIMGIAGGTGSGKTTLSLRIQNLLGSENVVIVDGDAYYKENSHLSYDDRASLNFDHPSIIDTELLYQHIQKLKTGEFIEKPIYDFKTHLRKKKSVTIAPFPIIIFEGILMLSFKDIYPLFDLRVFIDENADIRLQRRVKRDMAERSRSLNSIIHQYVTTVCPMHVKYVEPSKKNAHIILNSNDSPDKIMEVLRKILK